MLWLTVQILWKTQTDWMGGPGVLGPVSDWGTQYWRGDSITTASEGQVSLIATEWDYTAWVKHTLETGNIGSHFQGLMSENVFHAPADIDGDGDKDLVALTNYDTVVWYEQVSPWSFQRHVIGSMGGNVDPDQGCVYPVDFDGDGDVDVLASTEALGWWENASGDGADWVWHLVDDGSGGNGWHRVSAADFDNDGLMDILAADNSYTIHVGDIYIFWNQGGGNFLKDRVVDFSDALGWRVYPADFNGDSLVDFYSGYQYTYVFINQGNRQFFQVAAQTSVRQDGTWAQDMDGDGDKDIVIGGPSDFHALLNDGTGRNFDLVYLFPVSNYYYADGAIARDVDMDGLADIVGSNYEVGWFRQESTSVWPDSPQFTLYYIDDPGRSDWVYADDLDPGCVPDIDIMVTATGIHVLYENQMLQSFASYGYLESSILEMDSAPGYGGHPLEFYYKACVPNDSALEFWFRGGATVEQCTSSAWIGPFKAQAGVDSASFDITSYFGTTKYFQYKAVFRGDTSQDKDIAVLYEVGLAYEPGLSVSEDISKLPSKLTAYIAGRSTLKLELPYSANVKIEVYEPTGRLIARIEKALQTGVHELNVPGKGLRLVSVGVGERRVSLKVF